MATDARTYLFYFVLPHLVGPIRVGQETSTEPDHIGFAFNQSRFRQFRYLHSASDYDWNFDYCLELSSQRQVKAMFLIPWWVGPIPGIVSTGIGIKGVVSGFLQYLSRFQSLRSISPAFCEFPRPNWT